MSGLGLTSNSNTDNAIITLKFENGSQGVINYFSNGSKSFFSISMTAPINTKKHGTIYFIFPIYITLLKFDLRILYNSGKNVND